MMQYRPIYRILLILNHLEISSRIEGRFRESGDDVFIATDMAHGLELCTTHCPDLVLIEWQQSETGVTACKQIIRRHPTAAIILYAGREIPVEDIAMGLGAGACDYMRHIIPFEELMERMRVRLQYSWREKMLTFSHITINQTKHKVYSCDKEITLSKKEYALLEYLVLHKNRVCSREDIVTHIWGKHYMYDSGIMDVMMSTLRKKLLHESSHANIRTIRGVGFIAEE